MYKNKIKKISTENGLNPSYFMGFYNELTKKYLKENGKMEISEEMVQIELNCFVEKNEIEREAKQTKKILNWREKADLIIESYCKMSKKQYKNNLIIFDESDYILSIYETIETEEEFEEFFNDNFYIFCWEDINDKIENEKHVHEIMNDHFNYELHDDVNSFNGIYGKYFYGNSFIDNTTKIVLFRKISENEREFFDIINSRRNKKISSDDDFFINYKKSVDSLKQTML